MSRRGTATGRTAFGARGREAGAPNPDYRVFVSHGQQDLWVAGQIARALQEAGAVPFLDETDIDKGEDFKRRIQEEIALCQELVALFTPWSANRSWVWVEMGAAWGQGKPIVAIFYGMEPKALEQSGQGLAMLEGINVVELNAFPKFLNQFANRARGLKQ